MLERILQRFIATTRVYGFVAGLLSVPRIFCSNIISAHIIWRAYKDFIFGLKSKSKPAWRKTKHNFPSEEQLAKYKMTLADILLEEKFVKCSDLQKAIIEQVITKEKLGVVLYKNHKIGMPQLLQSLSSLYDLPIVHVDSKKLLTHEQLKISPEKYLWLLKKKVYPVVLGEDNTVQIAFTDPGNASLKEKVQKIMNPLVVNFALASYADQT